MICVFRIKWCFVIYFSLKVSNDSNTDKSWKVILDTMPSVPLAIMTTNLVQINAQPYQFLV